MSTIQIDRIIGLTVLVCITLGCGFYLHSFWAGLSAFGVTVLVQWRWK